MAHSTQFRFSGRDISASIHHNCVDFVVFGNVYIAYLSMNTTQFFLQVRISTTLFNPGFLIAFTIDSSLMRDFLQSLQGCVVHNTRTKYKTMWTRDLWCCCQTKARSCFNWVKMDLIHNTDKRHIVLKPKQKQKWFW